MLAVLCWLPLRPASAAMSGWTTTQGGRIRLLVDPPQTPSATIWGAVEIVLAPGWKTYWQNPGDTGVPPSLDLSGSANLASAALSFPAPQRHEDGGLTWAGYDSPVSLPVKLTLADPGKPATVRGSIFLGVCHDICVPVEAHFDLNVAAGAQDILAHTLVMAARAALPGPASPDFGLVSARRQDGNLVFAARLPLPDNPADLFVSGGGDLALGTPKPGGPNADGTQTFVAPITGGAHEKDGASVRLSYTLAHDGAARSGEIDTR